VRGRWGEVFIMSDLPDIIENIQLQLIRAVLREERGEREEGFPENSK